MAEIPAQLTKSLEMGESVRWSAQPKPYVYIVRGLPSIAYGATWSILGSFWYRGSGGIGDHSAFEGWWRLVPLLSLPFVFAGWSMFLYPLRLGARARRTWYVVTDRRVFIAEVPVRQPLRMRVFSTNELAPPLAVKRVDRLYNLILTHRAQEQWPHLYPRLEDAFFGLEDTDAPSAAVGELAAKIPPPSVGV